MGAAAAFVVLEKAMPALRIFFTASDPPPLLTAGRTGCASEGGAVGDAEGSGRRARR